MMEDLSEIKRKAVSLMAQLESERRAYEPIWSDLAEFIKPRRIRLNVKRGNESIARSNKIIDSTATSALGTLAAGMLSGITSPAKPWFRLTTPVSELAEDQEVKAWLHTVSDRMNLVFSRSNIYQALPILYSDMGCFGTGAMGIFEDPETVIRCETYPVGSYYCANDAYGKSRVFARKYNLTVRQLIEEFADKDPSGKPVVTAEKFSESAISLYKSNQLEKQVQVNYLISPNESYSPGSALSRHKRFRALYWEEGAGAKFLRQAGFDEFPVLVGRWEGADEDSYGTDCPGMVALGDIKALQLGERRIAQAVEKEINPPMVGHTGLRMLGTSTIPGGVTYDDQQAGVGFRPAYQVSARLQEMERKQEQARQRISRLFFEDLFLSIIMMDRRQVTATEIEERREEKFLVLGPVMGRTNQDILDPCIDRAFSIMARNGMIPPPPEVLQGSPLRVEYISILAHSQKAVGLSQLDRFVSTAGVLSQLNPESLDKVDFDQLVDEYGEAAGVPPSVVRSDDMVMALREQRQQVQQAQQMAAMIKEGSEAARNLSQSSMEGDNLLTEIAGGMAL